MGLGDLGSALPDWTLLQWAALAFGAALVGFAKTAIGGVGSIAVAIFALVLPARESTGAVLALLLVGDVVAVVLYRRHADWGLLLRLLPSVLPGLVLGGWCFSRGGDPRLRRFPGDWCPVFLGSGR
jgi:uncharacterized membrane protein YfcA